MSLTHSAVLQSKKTDTEVSRESIEEQLSKSIPAQYGATLGELLTPDEIERFIGKK